MTPAPALNFYGANAAAYNTREPEILLAGPAGTGKSYVCLAKCLTLLGHFDGCRGLFLRGTRTSLTQSGLVTWEDKILGRNHPVLKRRPITRRVRQSYEFENGSEFVVAGLDDPGKTLSAEYDFCYIQEATEEGVTLDAYEHLLRLLRNGKTPFTQLMMDCNPTTPHHWIYQRHLSGMLSLYTSTHADNPAYWDREAKDWTAAGRAYLKTLDRMSGRRRTRFLDAAWVAPEGVVYGYEAGVHLLPAGWVPPAGWARYWSIDWGLSAPTVLQLWAVDLDGRMYLYREMFRTQLRPDVLGRWAKDEIQSGREPKPKAVVCDHDEKNKKQFQEASGLVLTLADKAERDKGIETTQARFDVASDGQPRIFFAPNAVAQPDARLDGTPASTLAELTAYVWDEDMLKDEPIAENDHGMDAMRYMARYVDKHCGSTSVPLADASRPRAEVDRAFKGESRGDVRRAFR